MSPLEPICACAATAHQIRVNAATEPDPQCHCVRDGVWAHAARRNASLPEGHRLCPGRSAASPFEGRPAMGPHRLRGWGLSRRGSMLPQHVGVTPPWICASFTLGGAPTWICTATTCQGRSDVHLRCLRWWGCPDVDVHHRRMWGPARA